MLRDIDHFIGGDGSADGVLRGLGRVGGVCCRVFAGPRTP